MTVTIIIPAYNEQDSIAATVTGIKEIGPEFQILVVDDGSSDNTATLAKEAGAEVISHPYNKGYGAALKTGIRQAGSDTIVLFDADAQHDPRDIPRMIEKLHSYDMVIGNRGREFETHAYRLPGKWILDKVAGFLVGHAIPDLNCGFRCFKRDQAKLFFHILPNGFSFSTTITLAFIKEGFNVDFIPIKTEKRKLGKSQVSYLRDGAKTLLLIARITALFNPLKVFVPAGAVMIAVGTVYGLVYILKDFNIPSGAVLSILSGIILIFFGIMADQIACIRRQVR